MDSQHTFFPTKIIKCEGDNLAAPQSIGRHQQKHRVVAQSLGRGSVNAPQKGTNGLPGEGAWQFLVLVQARRIDLAGQTLWSATVRCQESKEFPQSTDLVLESDPAQALANFADVGLNLRGLDLFQSDPLFLQMPEKARRCVSAMFNGRHGQATHLAQETRVFFDQDRCSRSWYRGSARDD